MVPFCNLIYRTTLVQMRDATSHHASVEWDHDHL